MNAVAMAANSASRWWYGIVVPVFFGVLLYGFAILFLLIGPSEPAASDSELVIKVLSLAATVVIGFLLYVMTAIYMISFVLDWRYLSKTDHTEWSPSGWYLTIPLISLSNILIPVVATPVVILGGVYYLQTRSQAVGRPSLDWLTSASP